MDYFLQEGPLRPGRAAAALILVEDRYLLQLRDQKPGIFFPGHWGLFGGACDGSETPEQALRREMQEELGITVSNLRHVTDFTFTFGRTGAVARHFFEIQISSSLLGSLVLGEGSAMRTFAAAEILNLPRVVPYDSFALWLHASGQVAA